MSSYKYLTPVYWILAGLAILIGGNQVCAQSHPNQRQPVKLRDVQGVRKLIQERQKLSDKRAEVLRNSQKVKKSSTANAHTAETQNAKDANEGSAK